MKRRIVSAAWLQLAIAASVILQTVAAKAGQGISTKGLKWHLPDCARLEGDILTVEVAPGTTGMTRAWADIDLSGCRDGFTAEISARGEDISRPSAPWLGFKFMVCYRDPALGTDCWPGCETGVTGTFTNRTFHIRDIHPGRVRSGARLFLGLQDATGKAVFDLSTLKIEKTEPIFRRTNENWRVKYPERVLRRPQRRGVMSPREPTEKDFADLHAWGATLMRYQMVHQPKEWNEKTYLDLDAWRAWLDGRLDLLEQMLVWAEKYDIDLVVDLHHVPGGHDSRGLRILYRQDCLDEFIAAWRRIAARFKGRRRIYGYDLVNEPWQADGTICDYLEAQRLAAMAVREIDKETTIIVESNGMDVPATYSYLSPLAMDNVIYEVHMYNPGAFAFQGVFAQGQAKGWQPWPNAVFGWNRDFLVNELKPVAEFARRHDAKIYVGEFSAAAWLPGADRWIADCISIFDECGWDWTYHAFREWDGWSVEHEGPDRDHLSPVKDTPRMRALKRGLKGGEPDLTFRNGDRVLFLGDSITPFDGYPRTICDYYLTRFPDRAVDFEVVGVPGDGLRWCGKRLKDEVFTRQPTVLSVMFGMNDVEHHLSAWTKGKDASAQSALRKRLVSEFIACHGETLRRFREEIPDAALYWMTPSPYDSISEGAPYADENHAGVNAALADVAAYVRGAAQTNGYRVVDVNAEMWPLVRQSKTALVNPDRVHPNKVGHLFMAWQFLKRQKAPSEVSAIGIDCASRELVHRKNVEVTELAVGKDGAISFVALAKALPLSIAPELLPFAREAGIVDGLNREMLTVKGLASGAWVLSIDGEKILETTAEEFASGVNLALYDTPQMRQSEAVRLANERRFQDLDRILGRIRLARWALGRWSECLPDDLDAVRKFRDSLPEAKRGKWPWDSLAPYLDNWERRDAIFDEIAVRHEANRKRARPVPHRYEIKPKTPSCDAPRATLDIRDFGAAAGGADCTESVNAAIRECSARGGGTVVVPDGEWHVSAIRLASNVELRLADGAVLRFSDRPGDYLPPVAVSWEGVECLNYSPLVYAYGCTNVAITGKGTLAPKMAGWAEWFRRDGAAQKEAIRTLYGWSLGEVPFSERDLSAIDAHSRPHLIHFNRCAGIRLEDFRIRESPFWCVHLYRSRDIAVRRLDLSAMRQNNDGIDIEMCRDVTVEDCRFDQGDDAIVLKAGRNREAYLHGEPTENVRISGCVADRALTLVSVGSELSAGVRNVRVNNCRARTVHKLIHIKTNERRGGEVCDLEFDGVFAGTVKVCVVAIQADALFDEWKAIEPRDVRLTSVHDIRLTNVHCGKAQRVGMIKGDPRLPFKAIDARGVSVGGASSASWGVSGAEGVKLPEAASGRGCLDKAWIKGATDKSPLAYACGEEMVFTLEPMGLEGVFPEGEYLLAWKRSDDYGKVESGEVPFTGKPFVYKTSLDKPGFVRLEAYVVGKDRKRVMKKLAGDTLTPEGLAAMNAFERAKRNVFFDGGAGAGVDSLALAPEAEPKDFDGFWGRQFARLDKVPARAERAEVASGNPKVRLFAVQVDCAGLRPVTGYLSVPKAVDGGATFPCRLETHGYSGDNCVHHAPKTVRDGEIVFNINAHGLKLAEFGATDADTKALRSEIRSGVWTYAFDPVQNKDPEVAYFNGMALRVKRALQYLKTIKGWNGKDLVASGGSQGGLQTIWAAACGEGVTRAESGITWCCDMFMNNARLDGKASSGGWYVKWVPGIAYYDAAVWAKRIPESCFTSITRAGLGDYTCPPMGLAKLWNNIPGKNKSIKWVQGSQHGYVPPEYAGRDFLMDARGL